MKEIFFFGSLSLIFSSCKLQPDSNRSYADKSKIYKLSLNPPAGSTYYFDISNEYSVKFEVNDKDVENKNKSNFSTYYEINRDSLGNILIDMTYDKIHVHAKNGDEETDLDAANSASAINPAERMLSFLKNAKLTAVVTPTGETKSLSGYNELGEKVIANFNLTNENDKNLIRQQWEKVVGQGIIKKNVDDFFKIFPDSAIHVGDSWRLNYQQNDELPMIIKTTYTLKDINADMVIIESEGVISSNNVQANFSGYNSAIVNLKGKQQGQYELDAKTGMLISCNTKANVEGTVDVAGKEIPVTIKTSLKVTGKRIK